MTKTTLLKIINAKCMECTCGQKKEVDLCHIKDCPLWPYRLGKDPDQPNRKLTDSQKKKMAEGRTRVATHHAKGTS